MTGVLATAAVLPALVRHRAPGTSPATIARFRDRCLRRLVRHAYERVPYYHELFVRAGVRPADIRTAADLAHLPVTTKADLRGVPPEMLLARGVDPTEMVTHTTGGSTGMPFVVRRTRTEERVLNVLRWRALAEYGVHPGDRLAVLKYDHRAGAPREQHWFWSRVPLFRTQVVHCLRPPSELATALAELRPTVLGGYATVLEQVARAAEHHAVRPRVVISGGEVLTPAAARRVTDLFGVPVRDTYGSHEFSRVAWSCARGPGYHVCDDGVFVEVLRDGRPVAPGASGELIGTALHSFAMPFIRYQLGDVVRRGAERCACGAPFGTIDEIQGRMVDYFPLPGGRLLHPYELAGALKSHMLRWVRQYQLVQLRADHVTLRAVPATEPTADELDALARAAAHVLGPHVAFDTHVVPELALEGRGKFRVYRSFVDSAHDRAPTDDAPAALSCR